MDISKVTGSDGIFGLFRTEKKETAATGAEVVASAPNRLVVRDEFIQAAKNDDKPSLVVYSYSVQNRHPLFYIQADQIDADKLISGDRVEFTAGGRTHEGVVKYMDNGAPGLGDKTGGNVTEA